MESHKQTNERTIEGFEHDAKGTCRKDRKNRSDDQQMDKCGQNTTCDGIPSTFKSPAMHLRLFAGVVTRSEEDIKAGRKGKHMNTDWETSKKPKAPKKIRAKGIRGLLGVISPSKLTYYAAAGDKEVKTYLGNVRRYMNYRRTTTKEEWRVFYRYLRIQKRIEGSESKCTEI